MEISAVFSSLGAVNETSSLKGPLNNGSDNGFLSAISEIAAQQSPTTNLQTVYAGQRCGELNFWSVEAEELELKPEKQRTLDDVMAEIEKVVNNLKKEK